MAIFNSYVKLAEGTPNCQGGDKPGSVYSDREWLGRNVSGTYMSQTPNHPKGMQIHVALSENRVYSQL